MLLALAFLFIEPKASLTKQKKKKIETRKKKVCIYIQVDPKRFTALGRGKFMGKTPGIASSINKKWSRITLVEKKPLMYIYDISSPGPGIFLAKGDFVYFDGSLLYNFFLLF